MVCVTLYIYIKDKVHVTKHNISPLLKKSSYKIEEFSPAARQFHGFIYM